MIKRIAYVRAYTRKRNGRIEHVRAHQRVYWINL